MDRSHELSGDNAARTNVGRTGAEAPGADPVDAQRRLEAVRRETIYWVLSGLMHESRNALQQIGSCAEILAIQLANQPVALDLVQGVEEAQGRLVRMLDDLRAYSAPLAPSYRPLDVAEAWHKAWQNLTQGGRWPRAELRQQAAATDTRCHADPGMLDQVFARILEHALSSAASPAIIEIAAHETMLSDQPALAVVIADHGRDLTPAEQRQLFEPFFCPRPGGSGLGMAVARRLVELHCGSLHAKRAAGRGAEIVLTLPRRPAKKA